MIAPEYGIAGVAIGGLAYFIMYLMKQHKEERHEWQRTNERLQDESNKNIKENTNILAGLKTLLEIKK